MRSARASTPFFIPEISVHRLDKRDERIMEEVFGGLSPSSRFARYRTGTPRLPSGSRTLLRRIDGHNVVALAAMDAAGSAIGLVWLIRTGGDSAELAIEVVDEWQGRGVGSILLMAAEVAAARMGIESLRAEVLSTNRAAVRVLRKLVPHATVTNEGSELIFEWTPAIWAGDAFESLLGQKRRRASLDPQQIGGTPAA
jgi:ribosomal protein S18 acetylase RimI-like enzyme